MLSYVHDRIFCQDNQAARPGMHLLQTPVAAPPDDTQAKYASAQQPDAPQQSKIYGTLRPLPCSLRDSATPCLQCHCCCSATLMDRIQEAPAILVLAAPSANSRVAAIPYAPIAANATFVRTVGTQFVLNGKLYYPGGTNWCGIATHQVATVSVTSPPCLRVCQKNGHGSTPTLPHCLHDIAAARCTPHLHPAAMLVA